MFGVSLGNYEATITVCKNGRADVLANEGGERSTPMMVTYGSNNMLVGTPSKQSLYRNINSTATSIMQLLEASETQVNEIGKGLHCKVEFRNNEVNYSIPNIGLRSVRDALSQILKQLAATARLCDSLSSLPVVIAVSDNSKTKVSTLSKCAQQCGFDVTGTYSNSVLSVIPYGFGGPKDTFTGHILVYDMGTSALSLTLLASSNGMLRQLHAQRFPELGGESLDKPLLSVLKQEGERLFRTNAIDTNKRAMFKLLSAAEGAKHALSAQNSTNIYIESLFEGMDFKYTLSRGKFEGICLPVFKSFLEPVNSFTNSAGIPITSIQKVVLVGGTCKIPKLQQLLRDTFTNSEVLYTIPPDQVTAMGAAMQGQYTSEVAFDMAPSTSILCTPESVIVKCSNCTTDPTPLLLLPKHTPIPCAKSNTVSIKVEDSIETLLLSIQEINDNDGEVTIAEVKVPVSLLCISNDHASLQLDLTWKSDSNQPKVCLSIKDMKSEWRTDVDLTK